MWCKECEERQKLLAEKITKQLAAINAAAQANARAFLAACMAKNPDAVKPVIKDASPKP